MTRRLRLLLSVFACEPDRGSEPAVGWNQVRQAATFHEVWAITRTIHKLAIEKASDTFPMRSVHWIYFELPKWLGFWQKGFRGLRLYYYLWQLGARGLARRLHERVHFDLAHHVTIVSYWRPSFLAFLPIPFVWGPVGGGESAPRRFRASLSRRGRAFELLRDLRRWLGEHDPLVRRTAKTSKVALATSFETLLRLNRLRCPSTAVMSQVSLPEEEITGLGSLPARCEERFRLMSSGSLLHLKGFHLGVMAFARLLERFPESEYWIVGDGPERRNLASLAAKLGVNQRVLFWGRVPRRDALERLADCDVLIHPSLHDSGGWVCAEAMAAGRPVICLDLGGPGVQVTEKTGIKIRAVTPEQTVADLAAAMTHLAADPKARIAMGERARVRVKRHFSAEGRATLMNTVYARAVIQ